MRCVCGVLWCVCHGGSGVWHWWGMDMCGVCGVVWGVCHGGSGVCYG